jgi:hypothetical protein
MRTEQLGLFFEVDCGFFFINSVGKVIEHRLNGREQGFLCSSQHPTNSGAHPASTQCIPAVKLSVIYVYLVLSS